MTGLAALDAAIADLAAQPQLDAARRLIEVRRAIGEQLSQLSKRETHAPAVSAALNAIRRLSALGALDFPLCDEDAARLDRWSALGWPGLLASMMLTAAWRWSDAPTLSAVADWMWGDYTAWLFAAPNAFETNADAENHASHLARHTEELARWTDRNIGSTSVRAAVETFVREAALLRVTDSATDGRRAAESRGRILSRLFVRRPSGVDAVMLPRFGRRLRVGFIARQWELSPDVCAAVARFEHLSPDRFEVVLCSTQPAGSGFARHCQERATEFRVFTGSAAETAEEVRALNLDVAVFVGDAVTATDEFGQLALHRVAGLQVALTEAAVTTGLPTIDLLSVPRARVSERNGGTSERLGAYSGPAAGYALRRGSDSELEYSKQDLGFGPEAVVFTTVVPTGSVLLQQTDMWARILAAAANACLVVHVVPERGTTPLAVHQVFDAVLQAMTRHGVAHNRVSVLAPEVVSVAETRAIVKLSDVFLGDGATLMWAAEALSFGIPVLAADATSAQLLMEEGLPELADVQRIVDCAADLATNESRRSGLRSQVTALTQSGLACIDTLATSEAFGALLETAFDELDAQGREQFRKGSEPISVAIASDLAATLEQAAAGLESGDFFGASDAARLAIQTDPRNASARTVYGRSLMAEGRNEAAVQFLLAAVQQRVEDGELWFTLAKALREAGKTGDAVRALESALRLVPTRVEGWRMLIDVAESNGATEIAQQAYEALKEVAPEDPAVTELAYRFQS